MYIRHKCWIMARMYLGGCFLAGQTAFEAGCARTSPPHTQFHHSGLSPAHARTAVSSKRVCARGSIRLNGVTCIWWQCGGGGCTILDTSHFINFAQSLLKNLKIWYAAHCHASMRERVQDATNLSIYTLSYFGAKHLGMCLFFWSPRIWIQGKWMIHVWCSDHVRKHTWKEGLLHVVLCMELQLAALGIHFKNSDLLQDASTNG